MSVENPTNDPIDVRPEGNTEESDVEIESSPTEIPGHFVQEKNSDESVGESENGTAETSVRIESVREELLHSVQAEMGGVVVGQGNQVENARVETPISFPKVKGVGKLGWLKKTLGLLGVAGVGYFAGMEEGKTAETNTAPIKGKETVVQKVESVRISDKYRGMKEVILTEEEYNELMREMGPHNYIGKIPYTFDIKAVMRKKGEPVIFNGIGKTFFKEYDPKTPWTKDVVKVAGKKKGKITLPGE